MKQPTISVAILNYQRREALRACLERAFAQQHPAYEVLVVDNASTDGSDTMVEKEFPQARLLRLPRNIGCAARNTGVDAARARVVVTIDNDVLLEATDALDHIERLFLDRVRLACVNFRILDGEGRISRRDWCHPRPFEDANRTFESDYVLEGACAFRRDAFLATGGYWDLLFLGHEGQDLALRLLQAGLEILYWPAVSVRHLRSCAARPASRLFYTFTRNSIWIALRNHRPGAAFRAILCDMALMSFASLRAGQGAAFLEGVAHALWRIRPALGARQPLEKATYRRLAEIRRWNPGIVTKARRHVFERPMG